MDCKHEGEYNLNEVHLNFSAYYQVIRNNARNRRRQPNDSLGKNQIQSSSENPAKHMKNEAFISPQNQAQLGTQKEATSSSEIIGSPLGYGKSKKKNSKSSKNDGSSKKKTKINEDSNNGKKREKEKKKPKRSKKKPKRPKSSKNRLQATHTKLQAIFQANLRAVLRL